MDFLKTPLRRRILFASLYLSEGAPIGFLWLALPTRLRSADVAVKEITWLAAVLVIPWTLKFAWAPLVDLLRSRRWTLKHWIIAAQTVMALALAPLVWLDLLADFRMIVPLLLAHAFAAATQDVAIDALCISVTDESERGRLNGWMQTGMLAGRAAMGGGALILGRFIGEKNVVVVLIAFVLFSALLLAMSRIPQESSAHEGEEATLVRRAKRSLGSLRVALKQASTWVGLLFALLGPAAFKALEVVIGPFLIDRQYTEVEVGQFTATVMIGGMVAGAIIGGMLADRFGRRMFVALSMINIIVFVTALAVSDIVSGGERGVHLLALLSLISFGIGVFTVAVYALFMDITTPAIAATQFSAFMGATNACESWSSATIGQLTELFDYPAGMLALAAVSLVSLPLLYWMRRPEPRETSPIAE